jgi:transcriptional regulatory protein LevR
MIGGGLQWTSEMIAQWRTEFFNGQDVYAMQKYQEKINPSKRLYAVDVPDDGYCFIFALCAFIKNYEQDEIPSLLEEPPLEE